MLLCCYADVGVVFIRIKIDNIIKKYGKQRKQNLGGA